MIERIYHLIRRWIVLLPFRLLRINPPVGSDAWLYQKGFMPSTRQQRKQNAKFFEPPQY